MKKKIYLLLIFAGVITYILVLSKNGFQPITNNIEFREKLSSYGLFSGKMSALIPGHDVEVFEISSTLFTDYAEKQRLIKIPKGTKIKATGNGLPEFPEGTIIAKTFYYSHTPDKRRKLIETRLLILKDGKWNAATYQWGNNQKDAFYLKQGATVPVSFSEADGKFRNISYRIPSQGDCGSCHRDGNILVPIGPKFRNLNTEVQRDGKMINQLVYLQQKGLLNKVQADTIGTIPDYRNKAVPEDQRARAYFAMNCAHCHQPSGIAGNLSLNLNYAADFDHTGIAINKENIVERVSSMGQFHMPKMGTTIIDEDGVALIRNYIKNLPRK